jgi:flagellar hook-associated protein 3 FlgL
MRITDSSSAARANARIAAARARQDEAQERLSSGRRINRPSDDPAGAGAVLRLRTSQQEVERFGRSASEVGSALLTADAALDGYESLLERARVLLSQAASDTTTPAAREATATEIEGLRDRLLRVANQRSGERYVFGGTVQNVAPYAADGTFQGTGAQARLVQIEPGAPPVASDVTASEVFEDATGTIFAALDAAVTAIRGTGDAAADRAAVSAAIGRVDNFSARASSARVRVGVGLAAAEGVAERLGRDQLLFEERAQSIESADLAESAVALAESARAVEATLQAIGQSVNRRTLLDIIG